MSPLHRIRRQVAGVLLPLILLSACEGEPIGGGAMARPFGRAIYGATTDNQLVVFGSTNPDSISRQVTISGLAGGESIVGIDFGPRDGRLYAVGMGGRIFTLDSVSGAATQVGATPFTPAPSGSAFGVDFNPVPNRIRLHSNQTQNLRLNQLTGAVGRLTPP